MTHASNHLGDSVNEPTEVTAAISGYRPGPPGGRRGGNQARLTNAFSRKLVNLKAAVSLWFAYYSFCRVHGLLRVTPMIQAGLTDRVWGLVELMG